VVAELVVEVAGVSAATIISDMRRSAAAAMSGGRPGMGLVYGTDGEHPRRTRTVVTRATTNILFSQIGLGRIKQLLRAL
jgi:hypothetical protein